MAAGKALPFNLHTTFRAFGGGGGGAAGFSGGGGGRIAGLDSSSFKAGVDGVAGVEISSAGFDGAGGGGGGSCLISGGVGGAVFVLSCAYK